MLNFETVKLPEEFYRNIVEISVLIILIAVVAMIILSFVFKWDMTKTLMWYIQIPKILVSALAVILVFCFDYETKTVCKPHFDDMLMSTFLVGVLALIELLSSLATMIKDVCERK